MFRHTGMTGFQPRGGRRGRRAGGRDLGHASAPAPTRAAPVPPPARRGGHAAVRSAGPLLATGGPGSPGEPADAPAAGRAGLPWSEAQAHALLQAVAAGDTAAFEQLYHHYAPRLAAFLRRRLGSPALVDEVLQEVMLVVWQQAARFQPTCRVSTWLCGIARYKAYKAQKPPPPSPPPPPAAPERGSHQANPEHVVLQGERARLVAHAVASLPPAQRTVVELTYAHACSSREIAQRLMAAESTVRSRLRLARQHLAHRLAQQGLVPTAGRHGISNSRCASTPSDH